MAIADVCDEAVMPRDPRAGFDGTTVLTPAMAVSNIDYAMSFYGGLPTVWVEVVGLQVRNFAGSGSLARAARYIGEQNPNANIIMNAVFPAKSAR